MERFNRRNKIILCAEDNAANLALLEEIIGGAGYRFVGCRNGQECLDAAAAVRPHLVFLDVQMPVMNGFDTCRTLRQRPEMRDVPIVFLTNRRTADDVRTGLGAGGTDFMIKPVGRDQLLARIEKWVSGRST